MTAVREKPEIFLPGSRPELFRRKALFLSASEPYCRSDEDLRNEEERADNERYVATAQPLRIRSAISHLCRFAFSRNIDLIFGGHPAISPLVLDAARRFGGSAEKRVVVFQSMFFFKKDKEDIPLETRQLADWELGTLLWTLSVESPDPREARRKSLSWMRRTMALSPNLLGAVFVGGMEGVVEEAIITWNLRRRLRNRLFSIGSTGSAAADLLEHGGLAGRKANRELLKTNLSYPLVLQRIFEDLGRF